MQKPSNVVLLAFPGVLPVDLFNPHHVFSKAKEYADPSLRVSIATNQQPVSMAHNVSLNANDFIASPDEVPERGGLLIVPGGEGARQIFERGNPFVENYVRAFHRKPGNTVASVCTGALVLARAGLLKDCAATTHPKYLDLLKNHAREVRRLSPGQSYIENPDQRVITAGGVMKGVPLALDLAERFWGNEVRQRIQEDMQVPSLPRMLDPEGLKTVERTPTSPRRRRRN